MGQADDSQETGLLSRIEALETQLASRRLDLEQLVLRDASGRIRGLLVADEEHGVALRLLDTSGVVRAQLQVGEEGGSLVMADGEGSLRLGLYAGVGEGRVTAVELRGDGGRPRVVLASPEGRAPVLALCDAEGRPRTSMVESGVYSIDPGSGQPPVRLKPGEKVRLPRELEAELESLLGGEAPGEPPGELGPE